MLQGPLTHFGGAVIVGPGLAVGIVKGSRRQSDLGGKAMQDFQTGRAEIVT